MGSASATHLAAIGTVIRRPSNSGMATFQEISLNPGRLAERFEKLGIRPDKTITGLQKEMAKLGLGNVDPRHLFANMMGMVIFPSTISIRFNCKSPGEDPSIITIRELAE